MALVTKNAVLHGRKAALGTALGVDVGLVVWTIAAALGVATVLRSSEIAFTVLKVIGAAYLMWLGARALLAAHHRSRLSLADDQACGSGELGGLCGFRQGVLSNLANPKIAALFTSLLPQFVAPGGSALAGVLAAGRDLCGDHADLAVHLCGGSSQSRGDAPAPRARQGA